MNVKRAAAATLVLILTACAEAVTADFQKDLDVAIPLGPKHQTRYSQSSTGYWEDGPQEAPADAPAEYSVPPVFSLFVDAAFYQANAGFGVATLNYFANGAKADVDLYVTKGDASVGSPSHGHESFYLYAPTWGSLSPQASANVAGTCGYSLRADGKGEVWMGWGGVEYFRRGGTKTASASQPACTGGGGGGGGGGGYVLRICLTTEYYSGNGEYLGDSQECWYEEHYAT